MISLLHSQGQALSHLTPNSMPPWISSVRQNTLIVTFPRAYHVLSWAPLRGGLVEARTILNHQVDTHEHPTLEPESFLHNLAQQLRAEFPVVGLMTGVPMKRLVQKTVTGEDLTIECFATVGLSNALAVGDPATYEERLGTINLIVAVNQALTPAAMIEAVQIVTEAKVRALHTAAVKSTVSDALATGTGTDCVAIACPVATVAFPYCGKHTKLGELVGQVIMSAVSDGIRKTNPA
jgi:adenosylcobinamide kinase/adenosylcobinamide-phosphate guanylyltransferase